MALSTWPGGRRFGYAELATFPEDNLIREIGPTSG